MLLSSAIASARATAATDVIDVAATIAMLPLLVPLFPLLLLLCCHHYGWQLCCISSHWLHVLVKEQVDVPNGMLPQRQFVQMLCHNSYVEKQLPLRLLQP